jgi:multiple sugar transport system permease protein
MALPSVLLIDIWTQIPFATLVLLAGLQGLPSEPYEAAVVDGASGWQAFWHITVPLMSPFISLVAMFRAIGAFKVFDIIFATTKGGPGRATTTLHIAAYKEGFTYGNMGTALANVFFLTLLIAASALVLGRAFYRASKLKGE